jgi:hypothetical protein
MANSFHRDIISPPPVSTNPGPSHARQKPLSRDRDVLQAADDAELGEVSEPNVKRCGIAKPQAAARESIGLTKFAVASADARA